VVYYVLVFMVVVFWLAELILFVRNVYFLLYILIIHCGLPFFYIMYKLCVSLIMQLSKEMLPNFFYLHIFCMLSNLWEEFLVTPIVWEQWGVTEAAMQDAARRALSHYCSVLGGVVDGLSLRYYPRHPSGST
jgi:hypothetical protein